MNLPFKIAARYLISKKSTNVINIISMISMAGVAVGTAALIIVLSVFNGFEDLVISLYNSFDPDMEVTVKKGKVFHPADAKIEEIKAIEGVEAVSFVLEENALLKYRDKQYIATIKGVDDNFGHVTGVDSALYKGSYFLKKNEESYAVLGAGIEAALNLNVAHQANSIAVYMPKRQRQVALNPERAFNRKHIFASGVFSIQQEFDMKYAIVPLEFVRSLLEYDEEISALEMKLSPRANPKKVKNQLLSILGADFEVKTRYEQNEVLYKIMKTEKWAVYTILTFILVIAAFNIIGSLTMLVIEKTKDIGILKAIGAGKELIQKIFLLEGVLMALAGTTIGFLIGIGFCLAQQHFKFIKLQGSGSFVIDAYPVSMRAGDFFLIFITVMVIAVLASWFPARRAAGQPFVRVT